MTRKQWMYEREDIEQAAQRTTYNAWLVLMQLIRADPKLGITYTALGEYIDTLPGMQGNYKLRVKLLRDMERFTLIERKHQRREQVFHITEYGRALFQGYYARPPVAPGRDRKDYGR